MSRDIAVSTELLAEAVLGIPAAEPLVLVRYGEIGLKGKNRPVFERALMRHLRRVMKGLEEARVEKTQGRLYVWPGRQLAEALRRSSRVFGVVGVSPAVRVPLEMARIEAAALALTQASVGPEVKSFKVEARRSYKQFAFNSLELNQALGAHILTNGPELAVDVHRPDLTVHVEIRQDGAYVYAARLPGPGGLPVGVSGRAVLLLSGGIDSPVAGWMSMKRGLEIEAVHFQSFPFTSERALEKTLDLARILAPYQGRLHFHAVYFTEIQKAIYDVGPAELGITIMRRMMFRLAERIALGQGALALVTGESLGQVASQTLESIHVINQATRLPVLRPLIGLDKTEITQRAEAIGTYETSILPYEDCCTIFMPERPATRPRLDQVERVEAGREWEPLLEEALEKTEHYKIIG